MADNTTIKDATTTTVNVASDDIGGVQYQRVKVTHGADGTASDASAATPLPVYIPTDLFGSVAVNGGGPPAFFDLYDSGTLDVTTRYNTYGTVTPTQGTGSVSLSPSTTASATSVLSTIPTFPLAVPLLMAVGITLETPAVTGNHRFWGFGQVSGNVGTSAAPLTDGAGFEVDTAGVLRACVYAGGTRIYTQALTYPTSGQHIYYLWLRGDIIYWTVDGYVPVATTALEPQVQTLPLRFHSLNGASPSAAPTMTVSGLHVGDLTGTSRNIADGTAPWRKAQVGKSGGIAVKGANPTVVTQAISAGSTGTAGPCDVSEAGNVTFTVKNTIASSAFGSGGVIVFEQSDDNVSWGPLAAVRSDTNLPASTHVLGANSASAEWMFDSACEGINYVRARLTNGVATNGITIVITPGGMPFTPAVAILSPIRVTHNLSAFGVTAGTTATEAMVTLARQVGTNTPTTASTFAVASGKTFRIQQITIGLVGNSTTATAANCMFRLRNSASGTVTTASNIGWQFRLAVPATLGVGITQTFAFADGMDLPGGGSVNYGFSVLPTYATNAPTYDISVTGYEF